jgi:hypothetical protein
MSSKGHHKKSNIAHERLQRIQGLHDASIQVNQTAGYILLHV